LSNIIYKVFLNGETLRLFVLAGFFLYLNLEQEENNTTQKVCLYFLVFYSRYTAKPFISVPQAMLILFYHSFMTNIFGVLFFEQFYVKCNISEETVRFLFLLSYFFVNTFPGKRSYFQSEVLLAQFYKRKACLLCAVFLHERQMSCVQYSYLESIFILCRIPIWKAYSFSAVFLLESIFIVCSISI
jgi:hypothetical protein